MFHIQVTGMSIIYIHVKMHMPSSNDPLVIIIKHKAKYIYGLYYLKYSNTPPQKKKNVAQTYYHTKVQDPALNCISVTPSS